MQERSNALKNLKKISISTGILIALLGAMPLTVSAQQLPDLKITNVRITPRPIIRAGQRATLISGRTYSFRFEVANVGRGSVPGNTVVSVDYGCIQQCRGGILGQTGQTAFVGRVGVGKTKLSNSVSITPGSPGVYKFKFMVDPDNIYKESDESQISNVWETTINVR